MLMFVVFATTAMADIKQNYYKEQNYWAAATNVPAEVTTVLENSGAKKDGSEVYSANNVITVTADGDVTVTFKHDGGSHKLNMLGVDVVNAEGTVVQFDYHYGYAGGNHSLEVYKLEGLTAGSELTLRCFVLNNSVDNDETNKAQGYYTITNATGEATAFVKPAVDLANGVYVIRDARSLDLPFYNGSLVARGTKIGDIADAAYTFTITKGSNGYYTIQVANGDYVVYTATGEGGNVAVKAAADANDNNKWWAIREGNESSYRIIVPMTNDKYEAPGWNFSVSLNGNANKALGLYETNDAGSQWYITSAPYLAEGTMTLKVANITAYSNGTNIVKASENNSSIFTFKKGDNECYTIQDVNNKYLTYSSTSNHLLTLKDEAEANDNNKWWIITADLQGKLEILPKQDNFNLNTPAFNWAANVSGANTALGLWYADDPNSYCELEMAPTAGLYCIKGTGAGNDANWYISYKNDKDIYAYSLAAGEKIGAKHIWAFEECDNGFKLKACNLNKYAHLGNAAALSSGPSQFEDSFDPASKFVFYPQGGDQFIIKDGNDNVVRTEGSGAVNFWSGEANEKWQLVRVDEIEVSVNEFASICLPFAVEVEGATAYAIEGTAKNGYVTLIEKDDIAANEGAILGGNGTAKLNIISKATADWSENKLEGTTVDTMVEDEAYVLGIVEGKIGLYMAEMTDGSWKNNANKAYLPASVVSTANGVSFYGLHIGDGDEEDGTTAIEAVVENAETVIFDLAGRKVSEITAPGIYIVNGKKVIK